MLSRRVASVKWWETHLPRTLLCCRWLAVKWFGFSFWAGFFFFFFILKTMVKLNQTTCLKLKSPFVNLFFFFIAIFDNPFHSKTLLDKNHKHFGFLLQHLNIQFDCLHLASQCFCFLLLLLKTNLPVSQCGVSKKKQTLLNMLGSWMKSTKLYV